jgi:lipooligosaccharide transport system ATP-binding protein
VRETATEGTASLSDPVADTAVVELQAVTKCFDSREAVSDLSLRIPRGICFGLLGPNGAGKTTALRMIYGVTRPSAGAIRVFGLDVTREPRRVRARLGVTLQETVLIDSLSAADNLRVFGAYHLLDAAELRARIAELMDFLELNSHAELPVQALSGGYQRRVAVAMSLLNRPELWILDEPTTGLDPAVRLALWSKVRALREAGTTVLLTTHYMDEAERLCDSVAIMSEGRSVCEGSPAGLIAAHLAREVVEVDVSDEEAAHWPEACPGVRAWLRAHGRLMLFADDAGPVDTWVRQRGGVERRSLVVRPANLEDVFLRVTGTQLEEGRA